MGREQALKGISLSSVKRRFLCGQWGKSPPIQLLQASAGSLHPTAAQYTDMNSFRIASSLRARFVVTSGGGTDGARLVSSVVTSSLDDRLESALDPPPMMTSSPSMTNDPAWRAMEARERVLEGERGRKGGRHGKVRAPDRAPMGSWQPGVSTGDSRGTVTTYEAPRRIIEVGRGLGILKVIVFAVIRTRGGRGAR